MIGKTGKAGRTGKEAREDLSVRIEAVGRHLIFFSVEKRNKRALVAEQRAAEPLDC